MALVATRRIKINGEYIPYGATLPASVTKKQLAELQEQELVEEVVTPAEAAAAQRFTQRLAAIRREAAEAEAQVEVATAELATLPEPADLKELRRRATVAAKGEDKEAAEAAAAARDAAEAVEARRTELTAVLEAAQATLASKQAALSELE